jgi:hypothetical protein
MINTLEKELIILLNRKKYINETLNDTIDLRKKKKDVIIDMLKTKGYDIIDDDNEYKYLVKMPMDSVTEENAEKIFAEYTKKCNELDEIKNRTIVEMWNTELIQLKKEYVVYKQDRENHNSCENTKITLVKETKPTRSKRVKPVLL